MTNAAVHSGALVALLVLATGCGNTILPAAPTPTNSRADSTLPPARGEPPAFPAVSRPARIYVGVDLPYYPMHGSPLASRYVLYDDGTFALQSASANYPFLELLGTYQAANDLITFYGFDDKWRGSVSDDSLAVRYTERMHHADFLDGVYIRAR